MKSMKSVVLASAVLVAGIVTGGTTTVLAATPASSVTAANCVPAHVKVSLGRSQGTAGTTYIPIIFTNVGPSSCAIFGVPTIQPVSGTSHSALGPLARNLSMGEMPARHVIAKGQSVSDAFGVVDTGNYPRSSCVAHQALGVIVTLGSFTRATYLHLPITVCTKRASTTTRLIVAGMTGD